MDIVMIFYLHKAFDSVPHLMLVHALRDSGYSAPSRKQFRRLNMISDDTIHVLLH